MSSVQKLVTDEDVFPTKYGMSAAGQGGGWPSAYWLTPELSHLLVWCLVCCVGVLGGFFGLFLREKLSLVHSCSKKRLALLAHELGWKAHRPGPLATSFSSSIRRSSGLSAERIKIGNCQHAGVQYILLLVKFNLAVVLLFPSELWYIKGEINWIARNVAYLPFPTRPSLGDCLQSPFPSKD